VRLAIIRCRVCRRELRLKRNAVSGIALMLLLTSTLTLAFIIQLVEAEPGTIYIRADGRIDPQTANITSTDNITYIFTDDNFDSIVVERDNIVIDGAGHTVQGTLAIGSRGIDLSGRNDVTVKNAHIKNFESGIWLGSSFNNSINGNNITSNADGIWVNYSFNNSINGNNITSNADGIWVNYSFNNSINGNNITANRLGGIVHRYSSNNSLSGNNIANNWFGITLEYSSNNNSLSGNNIANNYFGITLPYSSSSSVYHNSFVNNTHHVGSVDSTNVWDDGYSSGGNYWSDYNGTDFLSGPYQNESGYDWIGDSPYAINQNNIDRYPLMHPFVSEIEEIGKVYRNLLLKYDELHLEFGNLNLTLGSLNSTISRMQGQIGSLNQTCISLNQSLATLQGQLGSINSTFQESINTIQDQYNSLNTQVSTILDMQYASSAVMAILAIAIVYLAVRKPKTKPTT
jgi:parallel beta-helix repeat protein